MARRTKEELADAFGAAGSIPPFRSCEDAANAVKAAFRAGAIEAHEHDRALSALSAGGRSGALLAALTLGCGYPFKPRDGREALVYRLHDLVTMINEEAAPSAAQPKRRRK